MIDEMPLEQQSKELGVRRCKCCGFPKDISEFYAAPLFKCKECCREYARKRAQMIKVSGERIRKNEHIVVPEEKVCADCKKKKKITDFKKNIYNLTGYAAICKVCHRKKEYEQRSLGNRVWDSNSGKKAYKSKLKQKYNVTLDQYNEILALQNNACAICKQINKHDKRLYVDCTEEGSLRGLLCASCKVQVTKIAPDIEGVVKIVKYIQPDIGMLYCSQ